MSAGHQAAPHARVASIPVVTDPPCPLVRRQVQLHPGICSLFPQLHTRVSLPHSGTSGRTPFSGLFPMVPQESAHFHGWVSSFPSDSAVWPASTCSGLGPTHPHMDSGCLSLHPRLRGGRGAGSQPLSPPCPPLSPPCPPSPEIRKKIRKTGSPYASSVMGKRKVSLAATEA